MDFFKSVGSALSFGNDSKSPKGAASKPNQESLNGSVLGGAPGAPAGSFSSSTSAVKANPFGAAFSDAGIAAAKGSPKRKGTTPTTKSSSTASAASPKKSASSTTGSGSTKSKSSSSPAATSTTKQKSSAASDANNNHNNDDEAAAASNTLSGGVESFVDSVSRRIGRSLSFKNDASPKGSDNAASPAEKKKSLAVPRPTGAATFSKFDVSPEEAAEAAKRRAAASNESAESERTIARARSVTFGTAPSSSMATLRDASNAGGRKMASQDPFDRAEVSASQSERELRDREAITLQGTSRVKYHGTSVVQGNTVHFLVVAMTANTTSSPSPSTPSGSPPAQQRSLALIGLLDPLGTVRASTRATVERCEAIRKLERVRISPREADLANLNSAPSSSDGKGGALLLVDPAQAALLGVLVPFLRRMPGVSAVDGFKADYWTAADAAGTHRVPLFDVEGPVDDLNAIAVLRLRCHPLKAEDAGLPGAPRSEVSTQTLSDAKALLHDDFESELDALRKEHRQELDAQRREVAKLQQQLDWKLSETKELNTTSRAKEDAMTAEIAELKRQLSMRLAATQTEAKHRPDGGSSRDDSRSTSATATDTPPPQPDAAGVASATSALRSAGARASSTRNATSTVTDVATGDTHRHDDVESSHRSAYSPEGESLPLTASALGPFTGPVAHQVRGTVTSAARESIAVYEPMARSNTSGRVDTIANNTVRAWDVIEGPQRQQVTTTASSPNDPLAHVRAKLARSEEFLRQARQGGAPAQQSSSSSHQTLRQGQAPPQQGHHNAALPLERFTTWEASGAATVSSIRSPAQALRPSASAGRRL